MHLLNSRIHMVGIGGVGMCGIAELLHNLGATVTGSDVRESTSLQYLKSLGIQTFIGQRAEQVENANVLVYSSAIAKDNVELQAAKDLGIPRIPRAEALAEIMRLKRGIAVAGTHGKTSTTSMIASVLVNAELKPTYMIGGRLLTLKSNALLGEGKWMVAEADESDGSFLKLRPEIAVITNIDYDHMDYFGSEESLLEHFERFANQVPFYGKVIACGDNLLLRKVLEGFSKPVSFYGFDEDNDFVLKKDLYNCEVLFQNQKIGDFKMPIPGKHNALNALSSILVGIELGLDFQTAKKGIEDFNGVHRRFEYKGEINGVRLYDDYAHHPTEIRATLQAFREKYPKQNLHLVFQPHRFSRTKDSWLEFLDCFQAASHVYIADIYPAGEKEIAGIDAETLAKEIKHPNAKAIGSWREAVSNITIPSGDILISFGAGDIWQFTDEWAKLHGN